MSLASGGTILRATLGSALGLLLVVQTLRSALRVFVVPRAVPDPLARAVFLLLRALFDYRAARIPTYRARDQLMAWYAPTCLLLLLLVWLLAVLTGYLLLFWAIGVRSLPAAFTLSGSSLLTLGFATAQGLPQIALAFSEAILGLILVALLIAYLPTMYAAFARREAAVALLEVYAGAPPSAVELLLRFYRIHGLERLREQWVTWESWFVDLDESHTTLAPLVFFRSPQAHRSWITAAGTVLDAAALTVTVLDRPRDPQAELCLRAGYLALQHIAAFFRIGYPPAAPVPEQAISITRAEFDAAYARLAAEGLPLTADREAAWQAFAGWRVTYDTVLLGLVRLTMAPPAVWSSDRIGEPTRRTGKSGRGG